jgi:hypothetical protein
MGTPAELERCRRRAVRWLQRGESPLLLPCEVLGHHLAENQHGQNSSSPIAAVSFMTQMGGVISCAPKAAREKATRLVYLF